MLMVRLDFLVFGYRILRCESHIIRTQVMANMMRGGISATTYGERDILIRERDYLQNIDYISGQSCEIADKPRGLLPAIKSALKQRISLLALLIAIALNLLAPTVIWDVRVSGCEAIPESYVKDALAACGVTVGTPWRSLNLGQIETAVLAAYTDVGWISIYRRGSVAYVSVKEAHLPPSVEQESGYSNVVAAQDCIITDITVTQGYPVVKVGQVVKRGEVLISGIPPVESGGSPCHAAGQVFGSVDASISVEIPAVTLQKVYADGQKSGLSVKILNFPINIFKIYRNFTDECVIIENNENCRLFGIYDIPVSFLHEYTVPYTEVKRELGPTELVRQASEKMRQAILERTADGELIRAKTSGDFTDGGYSMTTTVTVIEQVGRDSSLTVE